MNFKVNREILSTNEAVFDGLQEQSVELDYILPDYFPDIFKMIKCQLFPQIVSSSVNGDKICYELTVGIRILYCSEQSSAVNCIEQKMNYSKTIDLGKVCENPMISLRPKVDYVNCRVVNQRRLDLRGAISTKVKAVCRQSHEAVCDAYGMNIQLKKTSVPYISKKLHAQKRMTVSEEFDLGYSKPSIISIIRNDAVVSSADKKIIANKLIVKGDVYINILYSCQKDTGDSLEAMQFTLPYSQIVEMEGVDELFECNINVSVVSCDIIPKQNSDGDNKIAECELSLMITCTASKSSVVDIVSDAYSTEFLCEYETANAKIEKSPVRVNETLMSKASVSYKDGEIDCVHDAWGKIQNVATRLNPDTMRISVMGSVLYCVMIRTDSGMPVMLECEAPFEQVISSDRLTAGSVFEPNVSILSCSYNLTSTNTVELKSELRITGCIEETTDCRIITDISVDEEMVKPKDGDYALKLYFADSGEDIWEIAKKYSTSVSAIMEENDLSENIISERGMILIPMV